MALIVLAVLFLYPALWGVYIWDDAEWLTQNQTVIGLHNFWNIWLAPRSTPHYYPLVFTTFWLEHKIWGMGYTDAGGVLRGVGYHVDNLLLHIGASLIIFHTLKKLRLPGGALGAWLAAVIYAIHPVNVESVAWVAERKNVLCGVFFFASLFYGLKFFHVIEEPARDSSTIKSAWNWRIYSAALALFLCAMLSKTVASPLAPALLLMIWWRRGRITMKEIVLSLPFFILAIGMGAFSISIEHGQVGTVGPQWEFSGLQKILIASNAVWLYAWKMVWPYPVMQVYPRFPIDAHQPITANWLYIAPAALVITIALLFALRKRLTRGPLTAALFFIGVLFPALGFIPFYTQIFTFVADHYQYLACIAIIVLGVETLLFVLRAIAARIPADDEMPLAERQARFLLLTRSLLGGGILLSLGLLSHGVATLYDNAVNLWAFNMDHNPESFAPVLGRASAYLIQIPPDRQAAANDMKRAIQLAPWDWRAPHSLGVLYLDNGMIEKAIPYLDQAEKLMPAFVKNGRADLYDNAAKAAESMNLGLIGNRDTVTFSPEFLIAKGLEKQEKFAEAIPYYQADLKKYPGNLDGYLSLGNCLWEGPNDVKAAAECYLEATRRDPNYAEAWFNLALARRTLNDEPGAAYALGRARLLAPGLITRIPAIARATAKSFRATATAPK